MKIKSTTKELFFIKYVKINRKKNLFEKDEPKMKIKKL